MLLLLRVGVIFFSVAMDVAGLVPHTIPVAPGNAHKQQQSSDTNNYVHQVVEKTAAQRGGGNIGKGKGYRKDSCNDLIESFDGIEEANE